MGSPTFLHGRWHDSDEYRYGIDLLNFGFWWESHEVFEKLWHVVGPKSPEGNFFQALIQLAAAQVKRCMGHDEAAKRLAHKAVDRLTNSPLSYMGMNVAKLIQDVASPRFIAQGDNIRIQLNLPHEGRSEGEGQNLAATP
jgi:predicted metal-dependent hydrolase